MKVSFERRKIAKVFMTQVQVFFRKSLSKATFERKLSSVSLALGKLFILCASVTRSTYQRAMMSYGWEGNRRSGVAPGRDGRTGHASQISVVYPSTGSMAYEREMSTSP